MALEKTLTEAGHEIVAILVGKSPARKVPAFFRNNVQATVETFESPNFLPSAQNKHPNLVKSVGYNVLRLGKFAVSIRFIREKITDTGAELVVNFYELLTGFTYLFCRPQAFLVCVAHQYLFLHPDYVFPRLNRIELESLKFFTRLTAIGAGKRLALSFRKMRDVPDRKLVVVPPLLRRDVLNLQPYEGNYLHGYMVNSGFGEEIRRWHSRHPEVCLHFFWDKKDAPLAWKPTDKLTFHQLDDRLFLKYLAGARAYATTAGFESVCEAMYLGKPVLMVPAHIEQGCNAYEAAAAGAGTIAGTFDLDRLLKLASAPHAHDRFRAWVKQASWMIVREFRPDLLREEAPLPFFHRTALRWAYKLGNRIWS